MTGPAFSLRPFPGASQECDLAITGEISRHSHTLAIRYELRGRLDRVLLPPPARHPSRRPRLWEETCFEFFLAPRDTSRYWEFNLSPGGPWNVYRFTAYRRGMEEETAISALPFRVQNWPDTLLLALELDLATLLPPGQAIQAGVAAVIQDANREATYWALTHRASRPDFHRRDSFLISL